MRACFLGQNVCALGYGVAMVQMPAAEEKPQPGISPLIEATPPDPETAPPNRMFADLKRQLHYS